MVQMMCSFLAHASPSVLYNRDSHTWSKYSQCVFPIDFLDDFSERMISEMNNVDELFRQNMTEFLQTDIDGCLDFSLSVTTIHTIEQYLETFYMPPLDIDRISSIWDQILKNSKTRMQVAEELWEFPRKHQLFPFQSSRQCFISVSQNIDFLN